MNGNPNYTEHWRAVSTAIDVDKAIKKAINAVEEAIYNTEDCAPDENGFTPCGITEENIKVVFSFAHEELTEALARLRYIKSLFENNDLVPNPLPHIKRGEE